MIFARTVTGLGLRRPPCTACGGRQWLTRIQPAADGYGLHSFECSNCDATSQHLIAFAGEARRPAAAIVAATATPVAPLAPQDAIEPASATASDPE